jgi:hypothetical protein
MRREDPVSHNTSQFSAVRVLPSHYLVRVYPIEAVRRDKFCVSADIPRIPGLLGPIFRLIEAPRNEILSHPPLWQSNRGVAHQRCVLPTLPMAAALSANHLAAMLLPLTRRRLYIARDVDLAGGAAVMSLTERAEAVGIETLTLSPRLDDFNEDLRTLGIDALRAALRIQLAPQDVVRFMLWVTAETG